MSNETIGRAVVRAAAFGGRECDGKISSITRIVGHSRINSDDTHKYSDVEVLEIVVDLPDPGPLQQTDLFRILQPRAHGGFEYGFDVLAQVEATLASG